MVWVDLEMEKSLLHKNSRDSDPNCQYEQVTSSRLTLTGSLLIGGYAATCVFVEQFGLFFQRGAHCARQV